MIKKIKNATLVNQTWCGTLVMPGEYYVIPPNEYQIWSNNPIVSAHVNNQIAVMNDGTDDITNVADGLKFLQCDTLADQVWYKSSNPDVVSRNMDSFIEEIILNSTVGKMGVIDFISDGVTSNKWLGNGSNALSSNLIPMVIPVRCRALAITMSTNIDIDMDVECYKNGNGPAMKIFTWAIRNKRKANKTNYLLPLNFEVGDTLRVFMRDKGTNILTLPTQVGIAFRIYLLGTGNAQVEG